MGLSLRFFTFMHLVFLLSFSHPAIALFRSMQPQCHDDERSALLQFKESLIFNSTFCESYLCPYAYPKVAKWKAKEGNSDCCSWDGITCNEDTGHVIKLDLASSCLYGSLNSSSSLFRLVHLEWLSLACNDFNGSKIPSKIINLSMLSHLNLSFSYISGRVPSEILELSRLKTLDLSRNIELNLHKPSLKNLAEKLTNLKKLSLDWVNIFSSIPHVLANFSSLTYLSLRSCELQGEFPVEIFQLPKLCYLNVEYNEALSGYLPEFDKGSSVRELILSQTRFSGHIPKSIGNLKSLMHLEISECEFRGIIPSSIGNLTQIRYLDLSYNIFSSQIPSSLGNLTQLRHLTLAGIIFPGEIPTSMGNLRSLKELDIGYSNLSASQTLPLVLGNLTQLRDLSLSGIMFSGELPSYMGNLRSLKELYISYCNLSASQTLPLVLGNLTQLNVLHISSNSFSSRSPLSLSWISKLTKLTGLSLRNMNLVGEIPSSLKNLTQLTSLDMSSNQIRGPLPLMNLSQLEYLYLSSNQFSGGISTQIKNLNHLRQLDLSSNQLVGSIPKSIFELESLEYLDLSFNNLSGTVELDPLLGKPNKTFYELNLSSNKLLVVTKNTRYPSSPHFFEFVGLGSCNLSKFPSFLRNQGSLFGLDLSSNHISGEIPLWLLNASHVLEYLNLSHNLLTGFNQQSVIPLWNTLLTLDLRYNNLQGSLPFLPVSTNHFLISNNNLTGIISPQICDLTHLVSLDLSNNKLSGMLPYCLGNFSDNLIILELRNNKFHGSIPQTFMHGPKLKMIDLSSNLLEGRIPRSLANCTKLEFLNLGENQIIDIFPSWLGTLPELQVLMLYSNKFFGVIEEPETGLQFPKLRIIDLSHNRFTGELPSKYFQHWNAMKSINTSQLTYLQDELEPQSTYVSNGYRGFDNYAYSLTLSYKGQGIKYEKISNMLIGILLSNNEFTGKFPISIANLKGLQNLNLSNNRLFGPIPSSLGNLIAMESFDISNNMFSGEIPQQLAELTALAYFNISHNHLMGPIPQGTQFDTFPNSSFEGNPGLCGKYVSKKCSVEAPKEEAHGFHKSPFEFDWKIVLIGYAGGLMAGVALGHAFITAGKYEWFLMVFERLLKRIKRQRGHRN